MKENPEHKTTKIYYSMGEVAELFDVNPSLIRFWEKKFDILKPHKNKKGNRLFTPEDLENLKIIYHLVKEKGMTLAGAQMRMRENREGLERDMEVVERLQKIKAMLMEIRQELKEDPSQINVDQIVLDSEQGGIAQMPNIELLSGQNYETDSVNNMEQDSIDIEQEHEPESESEPVPFIQQTLF